MLKLQILRLAVRINLRLVLAGGTSLSTTRGNSMIIVSRLFSEMNTFQKMNLNAGCMMLVDFLMLRGQRLWCLPMGILRPIIFWWTITAISRLCLTGRCRAGFRSTLTLLSRCGMYQRITGGMNSYSRPGRKDIERRSSVTER